MRSFSGAEVNIRKYKTKKNNKTLNNNSVTNTNNNVYTLFISADMLNIIKQEYKEFK